ERYAEATRRGGRAGPDRGALLRDEPEARVPDADEACGWTHRHYHRPPADDGLRPARQRLAHRRRGYDSGGVRASLRGGAITPFPRAEPRSERAEGSHTSKT